ncbi:hypothetical protein CVT24_005804 [Panaeolus cyanescens]|uniref:DNA damage-inducible protein 1 n=1 Tax=Panaeolus cyanescens TaxID=181874 RepID=A0A409V941_9AGAR|nr:hypothetical protein CVT24_005804 [Panaeolus cyanescens]
MELTFVTDLGETFAVEIDPNMELENVMALLEAEVSRLLPLLSISSFLSIFFITSISGIPISEQSIHYLDRELSDPKKTMRELNVTDKATLLLRKKGGSVGGRTIEQDTEMMRLQILGDPNLMAELQQVCLTRNWVTRQVQPDLAEAARTNPTRFAELLRLTRERQQSAELAQQHEIARLNADPFDVEAQRKIEEAIRQQAVMENLEHALEYSPEAFGRVTMLYIPVEVNSHPIKAFVDSGAQQTIMSPDLAEACGLMRLLDTRFAGIARGVGTAKILGRVHSAQIKLADLHLPCSFTIMEGRDVDLLLGLDMLKAHQACIDLEKGVLRIQGREVRFLSEHELPEKARDPVEPPVDQPTPSAPQTTSNPPRAPAFPGGGNTLGSAPAARAAPQQRHPEDKIRILMDLGATREIAISSLDAAGGNVDVAASLLF